MAMFWVQTLLVVLVTIGLPLALFYFFRLKQLSSSPTYLWAIRLEKLEKELRRGLQQTESQIEAANNEQASNITKARAQALKKHLADLELDLLKQGQGIGPSVLDGLRQAGYYDVGAVADAFSLQNVPGVGPEREKTLKATASKITANATKEFNLGKGPEAAREREREAKTTRDFEQAMRDPLRTIAVYRSALEELGPRLALAHQNGSSLHFSFRQPALLSPDTLDAPLPTIDEFWGRPVNPVPMPASKAPKPLPEVASSKEAVEEPSSDEFLKPRKTQPLPPKSAPAPSSGRSTPDDPFDPFGADVPDAPKPSNPPKPSTPPPPTSRPTQPQTPTEQTISWFETMVDLGLSAAKSDGRIVEAERKTLLTALHERFATEKAVTNHVEIDACLAGRDSTELDNLRDRLMVLRGDQRRWGYRLCCKIMGPAAERNTRENEFLALLRRMLNLKAPSPDSIDLADPESVLEFDLEREISADAVRRQKNLLFDKYDPEKSSCPSEAEKCKIRRQQIEKATKDMLTSLGAPIDAPPTTEDPFAAPGSRHNPDLDDILG